MIEIFDDILEPHLTELINMEMKNVAWHYDYKSKVGSINSHWHTLVGHDNNEVIENNFEWVLPIWDTAFNKYNFKERYNIETYKRIYMNAHTHGIEPHLHIDDGDFTMIYYPRLDWKPEWQGGTMVDGRYIPYVGNNLIVFDAHLPHQAMPVSRECYQLRSVIVFKLNCNV
jgi:hypothetical protein